jgi:TIR domain
MDVNAIPPGRDFRKAIDESIHKCSVLLAILGPGWLDSKNASGQRRLDDESDFLRLEVASALRRDIPVIPVLVRGAKMPRAEQLSSDLQELAYRNAVEITHARWKSDVQVLVRALRPYLEVPAADPSDPPAATPQKAIAATGPEPTATGLEAAALARVSHELAAYIGPIAEIVVKRTAKRCATIGDLCAMVAQEIESPPDRARFLAACRF